jgi:hypothetical protein
MTSPEEQGLIAPSVGPDDEPDPEFDPARDWWDGMTVADMVAGDGDGGETRTGTGDKV